ncbi:protein TolQ [Thiohalomonas denitrificans]|uniref:Tol-Pal system protein TolQ n=1 Tax=Thiohalomonas denitrificans TaxID=415747 RepID=A0A1G5PLN7_9GAMM|nr:protein TolQ [Thiohalomonas denitrificans]SCZ50111.1 biopolymer transport protein TolQ [Thiohalomonas denitrificans]
MNPEMSLISLFAEASMLVQLVMLLLLIASLVSWAVIYRKWQVLRGAQAEAATFEKRFWSGIDLVELYKQIAKRRDGLSGTSALFEAGFAEFARLRKQGVEPEFIVEGAQRTMRVTLRREMDRLEGNLAFLATVGSTSPYVGLFGTVWGIMNSFRALGTAQHATLSMVAPGIAEALIATAMGLFAAIPAVIAYNRYSNDLDRLESRFDSFQEEFTTLLQRQAHNRGG